MSNKGNDSSVLLALGVDVVIAVTAVLSFGVFDLLGSEDVLQKSVGITLIPILLIAFFYMNYSVFVKAGDEGELNDSIKKLQSLDKGADAVFRGTITGSIDHIRRFQKLKDTIAKMLQSSFKSDMDFGSISSLIEEAEETIQGNIDLICKSISIFNVREYLHFKAEYESGGDLGGLDEQLLLEKDKQFREEIGYVTGLYRRNEEFLLELNKLIVEMTRIKETSSDENLSDVKDLVDSIRKLKKPLESDEINDLKNKYQ